MKQMNRFVAEFAGVVRIEFVGIELAAVVETVEIDQPKFE